MQLRLTWYRLLCEVWDASPRPPVPAAASPLSEGGRGLHLVAAYAAGWSAYTSPAGGKVVYAWWNLPAAGPKGRPDDPPPVPRLRRPAPEGAHLAPPRTAAMTAA